MSWGPFHEKFFWKKNLTMPKKLKGIFQHPFCRKTAKTVKGRPFGENFFLEKKSHNAKKKLKGGPFGFARYGMLRGKTGKTFLVQFARPNGAIWCNNIL